MPTPVGPTQKASKRGPKPYNYSSPGRSTFRVVDRSYLHQLQTLLPLRLPHPPFLPTTALNRHHPFFTPPLPPLHLLPLRSTVVYPRSFLPTSSSVCSPCSPYSFLSFSRLRHTFPEERQHRFAPCRGVRSSVGFRVSMKRVIGTRELRYVHNATWGKDIL